MNQIDAFDIVVGFVYLLLILGGGYLYKSRKAQKAQVYKHYFTGLWLKLVGTIVFCLIYLFYFEGGDTFDYHQNCSALVNLFFKDISAWSKVMLSSKDEYFYLFDSSTGYPNQRHFLDPETFNVSRILFFVELITFKSFVASSLVISSISYIGLFKLYRTFSEQLQEYRPYLFYTVVCIPSVIFWSGGMLKDTITLFCSLMVIVLIDRLLRVKVRFITVILILFYMYVIAQIKPYLVVAMIPGIMVWVLWRNILSIKNVLLRALAIPVLIITFISIAYLAWNSLSVYLGEYSSIQGMIEKAVITQDDLQNQRYDGHSFDIGEFEPTVNGALGKFPQATVAGLYRPYIFEAGNLVMFLSGLENTVLLIFTVILLFRLNTVVKLTRAHPIFMYAIVFVVIFGFAIGLSTSNFGALARFKIPLLPLFVPFLFVVYKWRNPVKQTGKD